MHYYIVELVDNSSLYIILFDNHSLSENLYILCQCITVLMVLLCSMCSQNKYTHRNYYLLIIHEWVIVVQRINVKCYEFSCTAMMALIKLGAAFG